MGCRNSIKTRILQKNSSVYLMGCPCHILHNTAAKAGLAFEKVNLCAIQNAIAIINIIIRNQDLALRSW